MSDDTADSTGDGSSSDAPTEIPDEGLAAILNAFELKRETRTGWERHGIDAPESVAAHSWGVGLLALVLADEWADAVGEPIDAGRAAAMAIVHDLGESVTGDVPATATEAEREAAARDERRAVERFDAAVGGLAPDRGVTIADLHREFEAGETPEARFVRELDKLEMLTQAVQYEREGAHDGQPGRLDEFFETADASVTSDPGRALFERLRTAHRQASGRERADDAGDTE